MNPKNITFAELNKIGAEGYKELMKTHGSMIDFIESIGFRIVNDSVFLVDFDERWIDLNFVKGDINGGVFLSEKRYKPSAYDPNVNYYSLKHRSYDDLELKIDFYTIYNQNNFASVISEKIAILESKINLLNSQKQ